MNFLLKILGIKVKSKNDVASWKQGRAAEDFLKNEDEDINSIIHASDDKKFFELLEAKMKFPISDHIIWRDANEASKEKKNK